MEYFTSEDLNGIQKLITNAIVKRLGSNQSELNEELHDLYKKFGYQSQKLLQYYCEKQSPDSEESRELGTMLAYFYQSKAGEFREFIQKYPTVLDQAIAYYKEHVSTPEALELTVSQMTGEQLVLVLLEYDRRKQSTVTYTIDPKINLPTE